MAPPFNGTSCSRGPHLPSCNSVGLPHSVVYAVCLLVVLSISRWTVNAKGRRWRLAQRPRPQGLPSLLCPQQVLRKYLLHDGRNGSTQFLASSSAPSGEMDCEAPEKARQGQVRGDASVLPRKQPKWGKFFTLTMQTISADRQNVIFQTQVSIATDISANIASVDHVIL